MWQMWMGCGICSLISYLICHHEQSSRLTFSEERTTLIDYFGWPVVQPLVFEGSIRGEQKRVAYWLALSSCILPAYAVRHTGVSIGVAFYECVREVPY
ncbi:hypothetical protein F5Y06DRAFT_206513 [Hypoxylon sp. FL0890]|nr:hypothetical protein F5Y06DRAFT_206513 [Hypoxylon sp. FL0890]